jgi:hypothetical protein
MDPAEHNRGAYRHRPQSQPDAGVRDGADQAGTTGNEGLTVIAAAVLMVLLTVGVVTVPTLGLLTGLP